MEKNLQNVVISTKDEGLWVVNTEKNRSAFEIPKATATESGVKRSVK